MTSTLLIAFALMLVLEGVMPFIAPAAWRETFRRLIQFSDGQIRFVPNGVDPGEIARRIAETSEPIARRDDEIVVKLHADVQTTVKVVVQAEA